MGRVEPDWEAEAYYYRYEDPESGEYVQLPMDEARDRLILDYLVQGDPRPLIHFLRSEHELGCNVRSYLALMLGDSTLPWRFIIERRSKRRRTNPFPRTASIKWRNGRAALRVGELVRKVGYEAAVKQVAEEMGIGAETVRKAYDRIYGKK